MTMVGVSAHGDDEMRRVYRRHVGAVYAFFATAVAGATAEDLTSATFERVLRFWSTYRPDRASERTWIMAIARNLLTDHFRRDKHRAALSTDESPALLDSIVAGDQPFERALDTGELRGWLGVLTPRQREIVALRYVGDLPATDIAAILGLTAANVHQILSRSLRQLREFVETSEGRAETGNYRHGSGRAADARSR